MKITNSTQIYISLFCFNFDTDCDKSTEGMTLFLLSYEILICPLMVDCTRRSLGQLFVVLIGLLNITQYHGIIICNQFNRLKWQKLYILGPENLIKRHSIELKQILSVWVKTSHFSIFDREVFVNDPLTNRLSFATNNPSMPDGMMSGCSIKIDGCGVLAGAIQWGTV